MNMLKYFLLLNTLNSNKNTNIFNNIIDNISISQCLFKNSKYVYFYSGYNLGLTIHNLFFNIKLYQLKNKYCSMNFIFNATLNTKFELDCALYYSIKHINHKFLNLTIGYSYKNGILIKNHIDIKKKVRINLNIKSIAENLRKKYEINYKNSQQEDMKSQEASYRKYIKSCEDLQFNKLRRIQNEINYKNSQQENMKLQERSDRLRIKFDEGLQFNKLRGIENEINYKINYKNSQLKFIKSQEASYRKYIKSCEDLQFKGLIHNFHDMYFEKIENEIKLFEQNIINIFFQKDFKKIIDDEKKRIEYNNRLKRNIFIKTLQKYANYKIKRILPKNESNRTTINKDAIVKVNKIIIPNNNTRSKDEIERDLIVIKIRIRILQNKIREEFLKENSKIFTKNEMNNIIMNIAFIENNLKILTMYESYKDFYHTTKSTLNRKIYKEYFTTITNYGNIIIDYEKVIQILINR